MALTITEAQLLDVTLGITDITWNGLPVPLVDRESPIQIAFTEETVMYAAAGNVSDLGGFITRHNIESINVPFIQSGPAFWAFMDPLGGLTSGGGSTPTRLVGEPLVITSANGVLTIFKAQPVRETTIEYQDTDITRPGILFRAYADITRAAGTQLWSHDPL